MKYVSSFFFFFTRFFERIVGAAATDYPATPLDQTTQIVFSLDKVPYGSNQAPRYNQAILFVVFQLAFPHSI